MYAIRALVSACLLFLPACSMASEAVQAAAKFFPGVVWQEESVVTGDFSCRGRTETAILGTSDTQIVVAVFLGGFDRKPEILEYSAEARSAESAVLTVESLDFKVEDFESEIGYLPEGLSPSKTCVGLNMSDQMVDSAHIYWNREAGRFDEWVL